MNVLKITLKNKLILYDIVFKNILKENSQKYYFLFSTDKKE